MKIYNKIILAIGVLLGVIMSLPSLTGPYSVRYFTISTGTFIGIATTTVIISLPISFILFLISLVFKPENKESRFLMIFSIVYIIITAVSFVGNFIL